jgi:hypothetical protein
MTYSCYKTVNAAVIHANCQYFARSFAHSYMINARMFKKGDMHPESGLHEWLQEGWPKSHRLALALQ